MSRTSRKWCPNSTMHITVRGNRKYTIFREYLDYVNYMNILRESLDKYSNEFEIISYVLMTNHIHLQIETKERHIGILMQCTQSILIINIIMRDICFKNDICLK